MLSEYSVLTECRAASAAKRCLFGEPDHAQVRAELVKQLEAIIRQDREKYNFNFVTGTPLQGQYEWEAVDEQMKAMADSKEDVLDRLQPPKRATMERKSNQTCLTKTKATRFKSKPHGKQLKLTGLFPHKKRGSPASEPVKSLKRHHSEPSSVPMTDTLVQTRCRQRT
ncbi:uncharacterized protein [Watersipora subatra]|uniref:uncharacterized protein n=1 Tax=Watersipora subatra TaxID=2589382 RepID=UPI00355B20E2